jgi:hypothetical protein
LAEQGQLILVVGDDVFVVMQFHDGDLVFLATMLVVIDLTVTVLHQLTAFADLVL